MFICSLCYKIVLRQLYLELSLWLTFSRNSFGQCAWAWSWNCFKLKFFFSSWCDSCLYFWPVSLVVILKLFQPWFSLFAVFFIIIYFVNSVWTWNGVWLNSYFSFQSCVGIESVWDSFFTTGFSDPFRATDYASAQSPSQFALCKRQPW